jgi:hypothetical protein
MRWFRIRKAEIDTELRQAFERHGLGTMQMLPHHVWTRLEAYLN